MDQDSLPAPPTQPGARPTNGVFDAIEHSKTLSVMPTQTCTAECLHCGTFSSPRVKSSLDAHLITKAIEEAAALDYKVVAFTGGEPTLAWSNLLRGIELAADLGLITRVVTNGHWATNRATAAERIKNLAEAGLQEINFSTGDQHVRFVPLQRVAHGVWAAAAAGMRIACMVEVTHSRTVTQSDLVDAIDLDILKREFPDVFLTIRESPWMPVDAAVAAYPEGMVVDRQNVSARGGCSSVLQTTTIQADGIIGACCGIGMRSVPELQLGNIATTSLAEAGRTAADDLLKRWIRVEGPENILAWASQHNPEIEWEGRYAHQCQSCLRLYRDDAVRDTIRRWHHEKVADILFGEWLLFRFNPE